jgi:hypothetical protein
MAVEDVGNLKKVLKNKGYSKKATDEIYKWYE